MRIESIVYGMGSVEDFGIPTVGIGSGEVGDRGVVGVVVE